MEENVVYAYVVADLLHIGHIRHLEACKKLGVTKLIVGVLTDEAAMEKKTKPIMPFEERLELIQSLKCVDKAIKQDTYLPTKNLKEIKPNILAESTSHRSADIEDAKKLLEGWGGEVKVMPYFPAQSSTRIKSQIRNAPIDNKAILLDYYKEESVQDCQYLVTPAKWTWMFNDHKVLLDVIDKFKIKTVLEIGTWQGFTAGAMLKKGCKVKAIDIYDGMDIEYRHGSHSKTTKENYGKYALHDPNYEIIFCDSLKYQPVGEVDMVFIDGNHQYEWVKSDTELARKFNPKVIIWHDYGSEAGVRKYIDEINKAGKTIVHTQNSLMVWEQCR